MELLRTHKNFKQIKDKIDKTESNAKQMLIKIKNKQIREELQKDYTHK
jgi:hypothetical protein